MGKPFNVRLFLLFAAWALLVAVAAGAIVLSFQSGSIRTHAEDDAAVALSRTLNPTLQRNAGDLSPLALTAFTITAEQLLSDQVRAIRLWSADGRLLTGAGAATGDGPDTAALQRAVDGSISARKAGSPQGDLLVSLAPLVPGAVVEVQQDYAPIAASVASSWRVVLLSVIAGAAVLSVLVQAMLWLTTFDLKRENDRLLYLHRTSQAIRSTLDLADVMARLARDAALVSRADLALTAAVEENTDDLLLHASYDRDADATVQHHRRVDEWCLRRAVATGETVQVQQANLSYSQLLLGYEPALRGPATCLCVPVLGRERAIGVLMVVRSRQRGDFKPAEVQMIEELAAPAAMAVEQAQLFAKVRSYAREIEVSYDTTLKVLTAALDTKDSDTQGHSERVAQLTVALAKEMAVPSERLLDIERGALLHDVGKIGVPDNVLRKPAALNEQEWEAMRKHPLLAALMVSKVEFLEGALPILLYHHERYDGTGYPFALEGKAIPLEARIFTVVDSYDAMTSDRPYRNAMPHDDAMEEINLNAGIQFDPEVVVAFARMMARTTAAAGRHAA